MSFSDGIPIQGESPYFSYAQENTLVRKLLHTYASKRDVPASKTTSFEDVTPKLLGRIAQKMDQLNTHHFI